MPHDLTNFLPADRIRSFNQGYFLRVGAVASVALAFLSAANLALLYPTYQYVEQGHAKRTEELALMRAALEDLKKDEITGRVTRLTEQAARVRSMLDRPAASALLRSVLSVPSPGVSLTGVSADLDATPAGNNKVRVSGTADSREALRQYHLALSALPNVANADLPLSAYASDTDISFSITLSGSLLP
jgi:Tfp pilus assembly protein PilN